MKHFLLPSILVAAFLSACGAKNNLAETPVLEYEIETKEVELDEAVVVPDTTSYKYSETRINDLLHMNLAVSFDWKKRSVIGKTELTIKPYFYSTEELKLDAKGMEISSVGLKTGNSETPLSYEYDQEYLTISLDKSYTRNDEYKIIISYEAFPEKIESAGSNAITSAQGIYFINPDSTTVNKPTQIWTQGETEANSVWFPTIDSPNERMTQEIQITVLEKYKSLSNGELVFSNYNGDGTRTDYWKQDLPHAPYLVMLAIGDYEIITESWENADHEEIAVDYYMEPEYAPYAKDIFGNTPEMLSFYSEVLGYPYPWDKYSQVIVQDFVSGAMENTSAVIHGSFLNATDRELLDGDNEAIIAHELFHHWFGDLVTCESWSNLPLNESFATYGEYLWKEYKYGRDDADLHSMNSMNGYLAESQTKQENLIRFYYDNKEDMFDGHSYNKGGRILHMLRYFLGDEAFFEGLKTYLFENEFEAVEIHQLRLAMEKVSGKDLNWFFNQWFLGSGHPDLTLNYEVSADKKHLKISASQSQENLFRLPLEVDLITENGTIRKRIDVRKRNQEFEFNLESPLVFANVDAEKVMLGTKTDNRPSEWWPLAYDNGNVFLDRLEAVNACLAAKDSVGMEVVKKAMRDPFWKIRLEALKGVKTIKKTNPLIKNELINLAENDPKSLVRAKALKLLQKYFGAADMLLFYEESLKDPSYAVMSEALEAIIELDSEKGMQLAKGLENEKSNRIKSTIFSAYAKDGSEAHDAYLQRNLESASGFTKFGLITSYANYVSGQKTAFIKDRLPVLEKHATESANWWSRLASYNGLKAIRTSLEAENATENPEAAAVASQISDRIREMLATETNEQVLNMVRE